MLGYFGVSIIHQTLTRTTGDKDYRILNVCMWSFGMHIHAGDHGLQSQLKEFCGVCTEFDSGETSGWAQSLAHNGCLSICWRRSIVLNLGFREWVLLLCTTDSPALSIHKCETLKSCSYPSLLYIFKSIVVNSRNCTAWSDHWVHVVLLTNKNC